MLGWLLNRPAILLVVPGVLGLAAATWLGVEDSNNSTSASERIWFNDTPVLGCLVLASYSHSLWTCSSEPLAPFYSTVSGGEAFALICTRAPPRALNCTLFDFSCPSRGRLSRCRASRTSSTFPRPQPRLFRTLGLVSDHSLASSGVLSSV